MANDSENQSNGKQEAMNTARAAKQAKKTAENLQKNAERIKKILKAVIKIIVQFLVSVIVSFGPFILIVIGIAFVIMCICNAPRIIMGALGFESAEQYVYQAVVMEEEMLIEEHQKIFSDESMQKIIDDQVCKWGDNTEIPEAGLQKPIYEEIKEKYEAAVAENDDENVVFDGYKVKNEYDDFWKSKGEGGVDSAYLNYFVPLAMSHLTSDEINALTSDQWPVKSKISGVNGESKEEVVKKLGEIFIKRENLFSLNATVKRHESEEKKIIPIETPAVPSPEAAPGESPEESPEGQEISYETVIITHVILEYTIDMEDAEKFEYYAGERDYRTIDDENFDGETFLDEYGNQMKTGEEMLVEIKNMNIDLEGWGLVKFMLTDGIKQKFTKEEQKEFNKKYNWRDTTVKSGMSVGYGTNLNPAAKVELTGDHSQFIETVGALALEDYPTHHIAPGLTIAQAILESGWGSTQIATEAKNFFGIKCKNPCNTQYCTGGKDFQTWEEVNGQNITVIAHFRTYDQLIGSVFDHGALLNNDRYRNLVGNLDASSYCKLILQDGYATDSQYSNKLYGIITSYGLVRYDQAADNGWDIGKMKEVEVNKENGLGLTPDH